MLFPALLKHMHMPSFYFIVTISDYNDYTSLYA
jgi:hypothetical protein